MIPKKGMRAPLAESHSAWIKFFCIQLLKNRNRLGQTADSGTHVSGTHFLRKTAATLANEALGDIDAVSRFLGHSSVRVTRRYTGETDGQKVKVSHALSAVFRVDGGAAQMFERSVDPQKPAIRLVK